MPFVNKAGQFCGFLDYEDIPNSSHFVRRFFQLDQQNGRLEYFMDSPQNLPPGTAPCGVFNVKFLSLVGDASKSRAKIPCCFYAVFKGTKHFFRADDQSERDEWISVLTEAAKVIVSPTTAKPTASVEPYRADIIGGVLHKTKLNVETNDANSSDDSVSAEKMVLPVHSLQTIHAGYCIKQGGRRKNWLRRYFTLTPDGLRYHKTAHDPVVLNQIARGDIVEARMSVGVFTNKENVFEVVTPHRVFYIQAESQMEREAWVVHINALVNTSKPLPAYAGGEQDQMRGRAMSQPPLMLGRTATIKRDEVPRNAVPLRGHANLTVSPSASLEAAAKKPLTASVSYAGINSSTLYSDVAWGTNGSYRPLDNASNSNSRQSQQVSTPQNAPAAYKRIEGSLIIEPPYGNAGSTYWPYNERKLSVPNVNSTASSSRTAVQPMLLKTGQGPVVSEMPFAAATVPSVSTPTRGYPDAHRIADTLSHAEQRTLPDASRDFQHLNSEPMVPLSAVRISRVKGDINESQPFQPQSPGLPIGWQDNGMPVDSSQTGSVAREAPSAQLLSVRRVSESVQQSHNYRNGNGNVPHAASTRGQTGGRALSRHESLMKRNDRPDVAYGQPMSDLFRSQLQGPSGAAPQYNTHTQVNRNPNNVIPMRQQANLNGERQLQTQYPRQANVQQLQLTNRLPYTQNNNNLGRVHSLREPVRAPTQQQPTYAATESTLPSRSAFV